MAETTAATGLTVEQWDDKFFKEYIQESAFRGMMGKSEGSVIQVKSDLTVKSGNKIHYALVNRLTNDATTGTAWLEGNEEDLVSRSYGQTIDKRRNAVIVGEMEDKKSAIGLRNAAKPSLRTWADEDQRDLIIEALGSINGTAYASAGETAKDAWLVDNADRVLFGAAKGNNASNDHDAALATIDDTNDTLTGSALKLLKRMALQANPKIRPISVKSMNRRYYVVLAGNRTFRDLSEDPAIQQAQREVGLKEQNNKLFEGGDLKWDNMIIKEVDDLPVYEGVGAGSIDVAPVYLLGAQALAFAWGRKWKTVEKSLDYGDKQGCAIDGIYGVGKMTFGSGDDDTDDLKDHGVATGYFAAVDDS
jgi:N4-gp56 family major capsid protein